MSRNGVLALERIIFPYSPNGTNGNPNIRQFFATHLPLFKSKFPEVLIDVRPRQYAEHSITGVYKDGSERAYNIAMLSSMGIWLRCHKLVNTANDFDLPFTKEHIHLNRRSVQGTWNPWLWTAEAKGKSRTPPARWDRKLSEAEWAYYVDKYSTQMRLEEEAVARRVANETEFSQEQTDALAKRWQTYVAPRLQTDVEANVAKLKADAKRGIRPAPVQMREYRLFASPQVQELGRDALQAIRRKEMDHFESWWQKRKEQLKPPA